MSAMAAKAAAGKTPAMYCCPVVYGSIAFWLGRKADELHTHKWTLFVRGPRNEDLSYFISKVVFVLHPSFAEPIREVTEPPFEVTEMGWGEFEATIRIFFHDSAQKATEFTHVIKLYPVPPPRARCRRASSAIFVRPLSARPR